jgi:Transposase DDE domain group 1
VLVDGREQDQVVHTLPALIGQRIVGIYFGYKDVDDHNELRHDPVLALFAEKLERLITTTIPDSRGRCTSYCEISGPGNPPPPQLSCPGFTE